MAGVRRAAADEAWRPHHFLRRDRLPLAEAGRVLRGVFAACMQLCARPGGWSTMLCVCILAALMRDRVHCLAVH